MDSQLLQSLLQLNTLVPSERDTLGGQGALRATRRVGDLRLQFNFLGSTVCTWSMPHCPMNMSSSAGCATRNTILAPQNRRLHPLQAKHRSNLYQVVLHMQRAGKGQPQTQPVASTDYDKDETGSSLSPVQPDPMKSCSSSQELGERRGGTNSVALPRPLFFNCILPINTWLPNTYAYIFLSISILKLIFHFYEGFSKEV